ncbi:MAG: hydroxysqualene dehydroxylase HpnE [Chloroflexota bacterium]|nr:hydroxysqualene dehydroxylase HpnE [Chloroflexota bacterium]
MSPSDPGFPSGVVILGGGIAGIAAALELLDAGRKVTLVESRNFLGGRAFSFTDVNTGLTLDNGQHVIVGCCTEFIAFLDQLGVHDRWFLQDRLRIPVFSRNGKKGKLAASRLPSPLHLLPSFLAYPHLSPLDKVKVVWGMARAGFANRDDPELDDITFYQWLRNNCQPERAINNLWNLVVEPTLNDNVREVSAAMGLMIVQEGMLSSTRSGNLGYARNGLLASIGEPARRLLEERGATLLLGDAIRRVVVSPEPATNGPWDSVAAVELASGRRIVGREFVSALPFSSLLRLLPPEVADLDFFGRIGRLEWSPILNLHVLYDRPVMSLPLCAFVDSPLQWVFNRNAIAGDPAGGGQLVTISVSAAWDFIGMPREELAPVFLAEMAAAFPAAGKANVLNVTVVKQREATFRCFPGSGSLRPGPVTPLPNLFLAGEWTNTGWPSTMEGAVRSGQQAARAVSRNSRL